jgi:hypothetical protein
MGVGCRNNRHQNIFQTAPRIGRSPLKCSYLDSTISILVIASVYKNYEINLPAIFAKLSPRSREKDPTSRRKWRRLLNLTLLLPLTSHMHLHTVTIF